MLQLSVLIKEERIRQDMTKKELAERTGYTTRAINYWESGKRGMTVESADCILNALGISMVLGKRKEVIRHDSQEYRNFYKR